MIKVNRIFSVIIMLYISQSTMVDHDHGNNGIACWLVVYRLLAGRVRET